MYPIRCAKVDVRTQFVERIKRDENWPFIHKDVAVRIEHRPLSNAGRSCRTTRHSPFLAPTTVSLTLLLHHPRRAEPILNGLKHRTRAPTSFQHIVAPLTSIGAQQIFRICGHERLQARHRLRWHGCHGRATSLNGDGCSPGTASPDAVPQRPDWKSLRPERPSRQFLQREWSSMQSRTLRWASHAIGTP